MSDAKRFEGWDTVDCNECARYWDSSCDGVLTGSTKPCNSFLATRSVVIPSQIKRLKKQVNWLTAYVVLEVVVGIVVGVVMWLG